MTAIVAGIYKNGKLELLERPVGLKEGPVQVLLTEQPGEKLATQYLLPGKYGQDNSTLEDFADSEWPSSSDSSS